MPDTFVVTSSSEFGINVRHCGERHLYLFGIGENEAGHRVFTITTCRPFKKALHPPGYFQEQARAFAEAAARDLGLLAKQDLPEA